MISQNSKLLFSAGLGLERPWRIEDLELEIEKGEKGVLHLIVGYEKGSKFEYEGRLYSVYDHQDRTWQHLNFFEHKCFVHARVPRVKTIDGKVKLIPVPWGRKGSSFTLKFEQDVIGLALEGLAVSKVASRYGIGDRRVFGIIHSYVSHGLATQPLEDVRELSVDETSSKKGHKYLTVMTDRQRKKVVGLSTGKDKDAFGHSLLDMEIRGADRKKVRTITMDMSRSYIPAAQEAMPKAAIVFDRFHIAKKMNEAVDQIRRQEQVRFKELKNSRYLWLKNKDKLTEKDRKRLDILKESYLEIGEAYRLKELLREVLDQAYYSSKLKPLNDWIKIAWDSDLEPIKKFVNMLHRHWYGIKTYFNKVATNAFAERVNLKIQEIKRLARGYRNMRNFMTMIYFHLGGLEFKPTKYC